MLRREDIVVEQGISTEARLPPSGGGGGGPETLRPTGV